LSLFSTAYTGMAEAAARLKYIVFPADAVLMNRLRNPDIFGILAVRDRRKEKDEIRLCEGAEEKLKRPNNRKNPNRGEIIGTVT